MAFEDRFNRQELIEGWNQDKLRDMRVAVIGSGNVANYTLASLAALGIGNIEIYDNAKVNSDKEFLLFKAKSGESKAKALEQILSKINPLAKVKGVSIALSPPTIGILGKPDAIVDATNLSRAKLGILRYAEQNRIKLVSAYADADTAEMQFMQADYNPMPSFKEYNGKKQGIAVSGILGGVITEELRKCVMPLSQSETVIKNFGYSLSSSKRFSLEMEVNRPRISLSDKKALIVGAGALGNFVVLGAALEGVGQIDILDFDEVDPTNLNRQILFYDAVGKKKAVALAEKVSEIAPHISVTGLVGKLEEHSDYFDKNKPDIILDCVDSFAVRAIINYFAVRNQIPLISGGTNPRSGQVIAYSPGRSACLDCRLEVELALAQQRKASSCKYAPDPSVIMTNQIVGNIMVGEMIKILDQGYGEPVTRILKYDSLVPARGGLIGPSEKCNCAKPDVQEWLKQVDGKAAI